MSLNPTIVDAIAGARYQAPVIEAKKTVLLIGAAGRLGERILVRLLGTSDYRRIYVLAESAMPSTEPKLASLIADQWNHPIDDVIAVVSEQASTAPNSRKRTDIFSALSPEAILPLARQAKALGVSRFMLVTPTDVLSQPAAVYTQLANLMEADLHQLGFASLLLVRPSDHEIRQRQGGLGKRFIGMMINTAAGLMLGEKHAPLSLENTARAVVRGILDSQAGLSIIESDRLHRLAR